MPRKLSNEEVTQAKQQLMDDIESGELSLGQAVRRMRLITGKSQKDFAQNIVGISPRVLAEIERGVANPTIETLNKIGRPFGYKVSFVIIITPNQCGKEIWHGCSCLGFHDQSYRANAFQERF